MNSDVVTAAETADSERTRAGAALGESTGALLRAGPISHRLRAFVAILSRDSTKFLRQRGRILSAVVRPTLWLAVFAAGFQHVFGVSIIPPYETYITYQEYVVPGLIGVVLMFNGMQSSLSMVYDREMGMMRLLLTAPLPRRFLLLAKLLSGAAIGVLQAYVFLVISILFGVTIPWEGWLYLLPAMILCALMLGALGLALSLAVRQIDNFAGMMNFAIFPMFFISPALYPLWTLREAALPVIYLAAMANPFTYAVDLIRFSAYGQFAPIPFAVVAVATILFYALAVGGYDPQHGARARKA